MERERCRGGDHHSKSLDHLITLESLQVLPSAGKRVGSFPVAPQTGNAEGVY